MEKDIKYWLDLAEYDLITAKAMLDSSRYIYVLFMCQQTIEKALKADVTKATNAFPPRLHNLLRLCELAKIELEEEDKKFLEKLSYYYLETRYPQQKEKMAKDVNKKLAGEYYKKTEEFLKWLKQKR